MEHFSRRRFIRLASTLVLAPVATILNGRRDVYAREHCYWWKSGSVYCSGGTRYEERCWRCCAGTDCWIEWCEYQPVGAC